MAGRRVFRGVDSGNFGPVWLALMLAGLLPIVAMLARFERGSRRPAGEGLIAPAQVAGALTACLGMALLAWAGMSQAGAPWFRVIPLTLALAGCGLVLAGKRIPDTSTAH